MTTEAYKTLDKQLLSIQILPIPVKLDPIFDQFTKLIVQFRYLIMETVLLSSFCK